MDGAYIEPEVPEEKACPEGLLAGDNKDENGLPGHLCHQIYKINVLVFVRDEKHELIQVLCGIVPIQ